MNFKNLTATAISVAAIIGVSNTANAKSAAQFYDGKTLTIYVGVSAGGIYGTMAQLLSRHMAKHMVGKLADHMFGHMPR